MPNDAPVVVQKGDNSLGYHDLHTGAEHHRLALDPYPRELALSSDGRRGYVCHFGMALLEDLGDDGRTVAVLDLPRLRLVATLEAASIGAPAAWRSIRPARCTCSRASTLGPQGNALQGELQVLAH